MVSRADKQERGSVVGWVPRSEAGWWAEHCMDLEVFAACSESPTSCVPLASHLTTLSFDSLKSSGMNLNKSVGVGSQGSLELLQSNSQ